jgi:hypothetical protein
MLKHSGYLIGAGLAAALTALPADARVACNTRDEVVKALSQQFAEMPVVRGLTQSGQLMEMFASTEGTWTLILSLPTGQSCLIANGDDFDVGAQDVAAKQVQGPREGISLTERDERSH